MVDDSAEEEDCWGISPKLAWHICTAYRPSLAGNRVVCGRAHSRSPTLCGRQRKARVESIREKGKQSAKREQRETMPVKHRKCHTSQCSSPDRRPWRKKNPFILTPFIDKVIHFLSLYKACSYCSYRAMSMPCRCLVCVENEVQSSYKRQICPIGLHLCWALCAVIRLNAAHLLSLPTRSVPAAVQKWIIFCLHFFCCCLTMKVLMIVR